MLFLQCLRIDRTETGVTLDGEQAFSSFLGPMFTELQDKFRQWLQLTYSTFTFSFLPVAQTLTDSHAADEQMSRRSMTPSPTVVAQPSPTAVTQPPPAMVAQPSPTAVVELPPTTVAQPSPTVPVEPSPTTVAQQSPATVVQQSPATVAHPSPTAVVQPLSALITAPAPIVAEMQDPIQTVLDTELVPSTPRLTMEVSEVDTHLACPGPGSTAVTVPATSPTSVPMDPYPKFITPGVLAHLSGITNIEGWSDLVQIYLKFETMSLSKSVSRPSVTCGCF